MMIDAGNKGVFEGSTKKVSKYLGWDFNGKLKLQFNYIGALGYPTHHF